MHLRDTYSVARAYVFIGYIESNENLYSSLEMYGYEVVYKPVQRARDGKLKGNVDADLVLKAMIEFAAYDKAVVVTSDGDFYCLVRYLREQGKLRALVSPTRERCSVLLKREAGGLLDTLAGLRKKLGYRK